MKKLIFVCFLFFLVSAYEFALARSYQVPDDFKNIQQALNAAKENDTIHVKPGEYKENIIWPKTKGIQLIGENNHTTIINGCQKESVIIFNDVMAMIDQRTRISGFLLMNGKADSKALYRGGGIHCRLASPMIDNVVIKENYAEHGGGIYCHKSQMKIEQVAISHNHVNSSGAGIYAQDSHLQLFNVCLMFNQGNSGAAVYSQKSKIIISQTIIIDNTPIKNNVINSALFSYNSNIDIIYSVLWNDTLPNEIALSEYSDTNALTISYANIRDKEDRIIRSKQDRFFFGTGIVSKKPEPFELRLDPEDDTGFSSVDKITKKSKQLRIHGYGRYKKSVSLFINDKELPNTQAIFTGNQFQFTVDLPEGHHWLNAKIGYFEASAYGTSTPLEITIDYSPPIIADISGPASPVSIQKWNFAVIGQESYIRYRFVVDQVSDALPQGNYTQTNHIQLDKHNYSDGIWFLHLQACDIAGNESNVRTFSTILDNTKPVVCGLSDHLTPTTTKKWVWTAKDTDSNLLFRHLIDDQPDTIPEGEFNTIQSATLKNLDGKYFLHVQARDRAGNISDVVSVCVQMNSLPPKIMGLENDDQPKQMKTWSWKSDAPEKDVFRFVINQQQKSMIAGDYRQINTASIKGKDGLWYIHVQARDDAGNESEITTVSAILDNTPPIVSGLFDDDVPKKMKQWQWDNPDNEKLTFRYSIDQKVFAKPAGAFKQITSAQLSDVDGIWHIHVQAKDIAGNLSEIKNASAILDNTKPKIKGLSNIEIPKQSLSWSWYAEDDDPEIGFRFVIDQNATTQLTGSYTHVHKASISEEDGIRYLHVQAMDRAGNVSVIKTVSGTLDNTPPEIHIFDTDFQTVKKQKWQWKADDIDPHLLFRFMLCKTLDQKAFGSFAPVTHVEVIDENDTVYIHVQAKDRAGNLSKIVSASKTLDNIPPVIQGLSDDSIPTAQKNWSWHTDPLNDKVLYQYSINQQKDGIPFGPFRSKAAASISGVDGQFFLHVIARDTAGNLSKQVTVSAILDNTPPQISGLMDDIYPVKQKRFTWTTQDTDSHILHRYVIDQRADSSPTNAFTHLNSVVVSDRNGTYYVHIQAKDSAGNISETVTASVLLDNIAPVVTGLNSIDNFVKSAVLEWQAEDVDKSIVYRYAFNQQPVAELYNAFSKTTHVSVSGLNGRWFLHVQAKDRAGNMSDIRTVWADFDNIYPEIFGLADDAKPSKNKNWQWAAKDADHAITYRFLIDQVLHSQPAGDFKNMTQTSVMNCDGKWYLHVQAKDSAGNESPVKTVYATLDNTVPVITGLSNETKPVKKHQWIWSAKDTDDIILYRHLIDQYEHTIPSGSFSNIHEAQIDSGNGIFYIHIQAKDSAFNICNPISFSVRLDNQPPVITNLSNDHIPKKSKAWQWQADDDDQYIVYRWTIDQKADSEPTGFYTQINETSLSYESGLWYIHVQAKDRAGNQSSVKTVSAVLDNLPPMVTGLIDNPVPQKQMKWYWQGQDNQGSNLVYHYHVDQIPDTIPKTIYQSVSEYQLSDVNGVWYIHVQAKDTAGNISHVVSAYAILDNIAPVIMGLSDDIHLCQEKKWVWHAEDADPDILYRHSINQTPSDSLNTPFNSATSAHIQDVNGSWYLHVQARDRAGNTSRIYSVRAALDNTPPVFEEMMDDIIPQKTKKWEWKARDNDLQVCYRYVVDQNKLSKPTGPFSHVRQTTISQKNGKWYLHIQAKDRAGNISAVKTVYAQMTTGKEGLRYDLKLNFLSSSITPVYKKGLKGLADILKKYPQTYATIEAHTDNTGVEDTNIKLSQQRADYVRTYLIKQYQIHPDRIKAIGCASTRPIADNNTPEGRLKNRRAEAIICYKKFNE